METRDNFAVFFKIFSEGMLMMGHYWTFSSCFVIFNVARLSICIYLHEESWT